MLVIARIAKTCSRAFVRMPFVELSNQSEE
ncbi:hypothetical protein [Escherichia phage CLB_P3]|nr:hypothetical protein BPP3_72 [Escherichia phage CLB_P3]UNI73360.1 hypothetical protein [Escherichia phage CLB_P3]